MLFSDWITVTFVTVMQVFHTLEIIKVIHLKVKELKLTSKICNLEIEDYFWEI